MKRDVKDQLAELANWHGRMAFSAAYRILGNVADAEDAVQEVFLKLLDHRNGRLRLDAVRDWGAYLRVAASRAAVDLLRSKPKWQQGNQEEGGEFEAVIEENPRSLTIQRQQAGLLRQAMRALHNRDATVFALRYFEDCSYEEIAEQMQISVNSVGVILHRARKRLREILEPIVGDTAPPNDRPERRAINTEGE